MEKPKGISWSEMIAIAIFLGIISGIYDLNSIIMIIIYSIIIYHRDEILRLEHEINIIKKSKKKK